MDQNTEMFPHWSHRKHSFPELLLRIWRRENICRISCNVCTFSFSTEDILSIQIISNLFLWIFVQSLRTGCDTRIACRRNQRRHWFRLQPRFGIRVDRLIGTKTKRIPWIVRLSRFKRVVGWKSFRGSRKRRTFQRIVIVRSLFRFRELTTSERRISVYGKLLHY